MANYPTHKIMLESEVQTENEFIDDFSLGGIQHSRQFHSQPYYRFSLLHNLTLAQFEALVATYDADPRVAYTLTYDIVSPTVTYTVKFLGRPQRVVNHGRNRFTVQSLLRGTKD
jgi:hypothetical protein